MDSALKLRHLVEAQRQVADSSARISRQQLLIEELARNGQDSGEARELLEKFLDAHEQHEQDRDRIRAALVNPPAAPRGGWRAAG